MPSEMDPVESFLSAPASTVGRIFLGLAPLALGLTINACAWLSNGLVSIFALFAASFLSIFWWAAYGLAGMGFGLVTLLGMAVTYIVFLRDECGKLGYFLLFTFAAAHYVPVSLVGGGNRWWLTLLLYLFISAAYWLTPLFVRWYVAKNEPEAIGPPPKTAMQAAWEKQSAHAPDEPPAAGR